MPTAGCRPKLAAMTQRPTDPRRLDVAAFAAAAATLHGRWPLAGMARLLASAEGQDETNRQAEVVWQVVGEQTPPRGTAPRLWLHLAADAEVTMTCQRCLRPVTLPLSIGRRFGFVSGEAEAAALDTDSDDDVLALERTFDLHALVEDELLLALPLVPRHADCRPPAPPVSTDDAAPTAQSEAPADAPAQHPFAALAALRRKAH